MNITFEPISADFRDTGHSTSVTYMSSNTESRVVIGCLNLKLGVNLWLHDMERKFDYLADSLTVEWHDGEVFAIRSELDLVLALLRF
jgi:hypothetical protein